MTRIIKAVGWQYGKPCARESYLTKKNIKYLQKELEFIDFSETTALSNWVTIKFIGEKQIWVEDGCRLMFDKQFNKSMKQHG